MKKNVDSCAQFSKITFYQLLENPKQDLQHNV